MKEFMLLKFAGTQIWSRCERFRLILLLFVDTAKNGPKLAPLAAHLESWTVG